MKVVADVNWDFDGDGAEARDKSASEAWVTLVVTHDTDNDGAFEPGSDDDSWTLQERTSRRGQANFTLKNFPNGRYQAQVTGLIHDVLIWEPSLDHDNPSQY